MARSRAATRPGRARGSARAGWVRASRRIWLFFLLDPLLERLGAPRRACAACVGMVVHARVRGRLHGLWVAGPRRTGTGSVDNPPLAAGRCLRRRAGRAGRRDGRLRGRRPGWPPWSTSRSPASWSSRCRWPGRSCSASSASWSRSAPVAGWGSQAGHGVRRCWRRRWRSSGHARGDQPQHRPARAPSEENAELAVENERTRFARDLHDILGHSLTVITVKAELAQRLLDVDPERARAELADLERLRRDALADVRRAVDGLPRADPARRAGPGPDGAAGRRDRGRAAELHRRRARRAARAVRLDRPRGRHQRDPALRRAHAARSG